MAHFINARETLVTDAIDGLIAASGGRLARLDGYPDIRVVDITSLAKQPVNYGDSSLFANVDVLWHPGDKGMEGMARALSRAILENR